MSCAPEELAVRLRPPLLPGCPGQGPLVHRGRVWLGAWTGRLRGGEQAPELVGLGVREAHRAPPGAVQRQPYSTDLLDGTATHPQICATEPLPVPQRATSPSGPPVRTFQRSATRALGDWLDRGRDRGGSRAPSDAADYGDEPPGTATPTATEPECPPLEPEVDRGCLTGSSSMVAPAA